MDKDTQCISFDIGKLKIDNGNILLDFDEHRKICNKNGNVSFEYGKMMNGDKMLIVGHSIIPEKDIKNYKFVMLVYKNGKKIKQETVTYHQVLDLFQKDAKSHLLMNLSKSNKPVIRSTPKTAEREKAARPIVTPKAIRPIVTPKVPRPTITPKGPTKLLPGKTDNHVINPMTGKEIIINGPTYKELCSSGAYIC